MGLGAGLALSLVVPMLAVPSGADVVTVVDDTREIGHKTYAVPEVAGRADVKRAAAPTPAIGTTREWLGLDDVKSKFYRKSFTLRAVGAHIEVWVAEDLAFPEGDCRTDPVAVTDGQIAGLVHEFDTVIYPRETAAFS